MKKFFTLMGIVVLGLFSSAYACEDTTGDDQTTDDGSVVNDGKNDGNTEDNSLKDNGFTDAEIAKANTAANISSMSQMDKDIVLYCNLARLDGARFWAAYGNYASGSKSYVSSLESDLKEVKNRPMLVPEKSLMAAAAYHANDMSANTFFDHSSSDGTGFGSRVRRFYEGGYIAENISAGMNSAIGVVMQLLVDDGLSSLGHRKNILSEVYVAIGVKTATHAQWRSVTVQDFGDTINEKMR